MDSSITRLRKLNLGSEERPLAQSFATGLASLIEADADDLERGHVPFREFIEVVNPKYQFYRVSEMMVDRLQAVADGEIRRLMMFLPPRAGKSETVSRLFPAYYLYRHPDKWFGLNSYAAELAYSLSRNSRANYVRWGGELAKDAQAVKQWETTQGGGMWAAGVGGAITGKGFDCGSIDDPIKNAEEAQSETLMEKHWDWWKSTFFTRAQNDESAIIVTQTRWIQDDLSGRILEAERASPRPQEWHILNFEAIKSERGYSFPESCTVEEDWREPGEALNPDRQPLEVLMDIKDSVGSYWWSALYQQAPAAEEGNIWKREWFNKDTVLYDVLPENSEGQKLVHSGGFDWDTAYTSNEKNAANAYVMSFRDDNGNVYIHDIDWRWCEEPELVSWMREKGGPHYVEDKATGKSAVSWLDREGIVAIEVSVHGGGDKEARTRAITPRAEAGKIKVRRAILERLLDDDKQGILAFPNSRWKDLNDALVQAINRHTQSTVSGLTEQWTF